MQTLRSCSDVQRRLFQRTYLHLVDGTPIAEKIVDVFVSDELLGLYPVALDVVRTCTFDADSEQVRKAMFVSRQLAYFDRASLRPMSRLVAEARDNFVAGGILTCMRPWMRTISYLITLLPIREIRCTSGD